MGFFIRDEAGLFEKNQCLGQERSNALEVRNSSRKKVVHLYFSTRCWCAAVELVLLYRGIAVCTITRRRRPFLGATLITSATVKLLILRTADFAVVLVLLSHATGGAESF